MWDNKGRGVGQCGAVRNAKTPGDLPQRLWHRFASPTRRDPLPDGGSVGVLVAEAMQPPWQLPLRMGQPNSRSGYWS